VVLAIKLPCWAKEKLKKMRRNNNTNLLLMPGRNFRASERNPVSQEYSLEQWVIGAGLLG
jgi:hypothetical protein